LPHPRYQDQWVAYWEWLVENNDVEVAYAKYHAQRIGQFEFEGRIYFDELATEGMNIASCERFVTGTEGYSDTTHASGAFDIVLRNIRMRAARYWLGEIAGDSFLTKHRGETVLLDVCDSETKSTLRVLASEVAKIINDGEFNDVIRWL
jgi:hypothetical protein